MRFIVSLMCTAGVALTLIGIFQPWFIYDEMGMKESLVDLHYYLGTDPYYSTTFAYAIAKYVIIIGLAISISSMLGGFITMAGTCLFTIAGFTSRQSINSFVFEGRDELNFHVYPGIGILITIIGAAIIIASIKYPIEYSFHTDEKRPRLRTWHIGRAKSLEIVPQVSITKTD